MANIHYKNYESHHKQRNYTVFYFHSKDPADYFEALLIENEIPYERGMGKDLVKRHLFGVHKTYQEKVEMLNNQTSNYFRKPFLGDNFLKYAVLFFTFIVIIIAIVGYFLSMNR